MNTIELTDAELFVVSAAAAFTRGEVNDTDEAFAVLDSAAEKLMKVLHEIGSEDLGRLMRAAAEAGGVQNVRDLLA